MGELGTYIYPLRDSIGYLIPPFPSNQEEYEYDPEYTSVTIVHRWPLELSLLSAEACKMLLSLSS